MSAHASQAFSIAHCTDSEDLPCTSNHSAFYNQLHTALTKSSRQAQSQCDVQLHDFTANR